MSKYNDAATALRRQAVKYESLMSAAKALDEVGSLDQAATECQAAVEAGKIELQAVQAELGASKEDLKEHKDKVKVAKAVAQAQIDGLLQDAQDNAKAVLDAANVTAAQIKAGATAEAGAYLNAATVRVGELVAERRALEQQISANLDTLNAQKTEAEDLEKRLAKAQASIAKLLG